MKEFLNRAISPCLYCTRVKDPVNCENKNCKVWQKWFLSRWELIRGYPRQAMDQIPLKPVGIPLGGHTYCHPSQRRAYIQNDPCKTCKCPRDLCTVPCRLRRAWDEAKGDIRI